MKFLNCSLMLTAFKGKIVSSAFINNEEDVVYGAESTYVRYEVKVLGSLKGYQTSGTNEYVYSPSGFTCSIPTLVEEETYLIAGMYHLKAHLHWQKPNLIKNMGFSMYHLHCQKYP